MTLVSANNVFVSARTAWFLAAAAVTAALFSSFTSALASSVSANWFVTSASDNTFVNSFLASFSSVVCFASDFAFSSTFFSSALATTPAA